MARLILDEGGKRRAFKIREGRLTVGSGEGCTLKLASADVADVHAEIELKGGLATLVPRPGVLPPKVDGRTVNQRATLSDGQRFEIGSARFQIEYEESEKHETPAAGPAAPARVKGPAVQRPAAARGGAADGGGGRVQRQRRTIKRGMPTWLVLVLTGAGILVAGFAVYGFLGQMDQDLQTPLATYNEALKNFKERAHQATKAKLETIDMAHEEVTPELRRNIEALKQAVKEAEQADQLAEYNIRGTEYLQTQLKRFVDDRLQGEPDPSKVRVFLLRCRDFKQRWPQHPEMDWVVRYENRFKGIVDLSRPPSYDDVAFEVKTLTWAMPRNYVKAFHILEAFSSDASPEDRAKAGALEEALRSEQQEYFTDRMYQAKYEWEREQHGAAVGWLVELIIGVTEPSMRQQAAEELVKLPGIDNWFKSYKEHEPEKFEKLVSQPTVAEKARKVGVL